MASIAEARNCSINLDDSKVSNSDYIVSESIEYTADESHNISFISALDKSELDIEFEICEEILNNDLENIFDSPESALENHPGATIEGSHQPKKIKLESSSNVSEDDLDSEIKKCWDILKREEPSDTDASGHLGQIPQTAQSNNTGDSLSLLTEKEIKTEKLESSIPTEIAIKSENVTTYASVHLGQIPLPAQSINTTDVLSISKEKEIKEYQIPVRVKLEDIPYPISEETKSEIHVKNFNLDVKQEKDEDELSLFATETDISTIEEEYEVVESPDSPQSFRENSDTEQDDVGTRRVSPRSVVVAPQTNYKHEEREVSPRSVVVAPQTNYEHEEREVFSDVALPPETDYLDAEREDIYDSGWESMRNLSTEEERYKMVRKTWKSNKVPNPNRNLTYHSYRKRHLKNSSAPPIARKRKATSSLDVSHINPSKRQRSCTFLYDLNIDFLSAEKQKKKAVINNQMQSEVNQLNNIYFQKEQRLQREIYERRNNNAYGQIYNLRHKCQQEMDNIKQQYHSMANQSSYELDSGIHKLSQARNEVLQFFKFYKGLNSEDPTVLTASQIQELEDIENIYLQFDKLYK